MSGRFAAFVAGLLLSATAQAASLSLTTADGAKLVAQSEGSGERGVVLLHADGRSSKDWDAVRTKLAANGFHVVAVDLRGHGESGGPLDDETYPLMIADAAAAATWLRKRGATTVALVGAELGANLALNAAAADPSVDNVVMLSPRLSVKGVRVSKALASYGDRPVLFVAGADDDPGVRAAEALGERAAGDSQVEIVAQGGTGTVLFHKSPQLQGVVISWLNGTLRMSRGEEAAPRTGALTTGQVEGVETTGTRYGEAPRE